MTKKGEVEVLHRTLVEEVENIKGEENVDIINKLRSIIKKLGDTLYLPNPQCISVLPREFYLCPECGSDDITTILTRETLQTDLRPVRDEIICLGNVYEKRCGNCGNIYHTNSIGKQLCRLD